MVKRYNLASDLPILDAIFDSYEATYLKGLSEEGVLQKTYIPIDIKAVAQQLKMNEYILFGRLYYHLNHKYRYKNDDGSETNLFLIEAAGKRHCIHFPLLAGVLAEHQRDVRRLLVPIMVSIVTSAICSIALPVLLKLYFK